MLGLLVAYLFIWSELKIKGIYYVLLWITLKYFQYVWCEIQFCLQILCFLHGSSPLLSLDTQDTLVLSKFLFPAAAHLPFFDFQFKFHFLRSWLVYFSRVLTLLDLYILLKANFIEE